MILFRDIQELVTLDQAAKKQARNIKLEDLSVIENGAFVVAGSHIIWVGETRNIPRKYKGIKKVYSLRGQTVLPAFVECHTHSLFAGHRAPEFEMRMQGMTYQEIAAQGGGIQVTVEATRQAKTSELTLEGARRLKHFAEQGVGTVEIKSGYGLDLKSELKLLKIAHELNGTYCRVIPTYLGPHSVAPEFENAEEYLNDILIHHLPKLARLKWLKRADIFVEKGYFSCEQAQRYIEAIKKLGWGLSIHADQLSRTGAGILSIESGALSADHVLQVSDDDVIRLSHSEVTAVLLPAADFYLKVKYPPARKLIDQGARVALSTDFNPGSSPTQDINFVGLLARMEMKMSLHEVIVAYTLGGAYALGLQDQIGSLEAGKSADFIISQKSWSEFFYSVGEKLVTELWVGGRRVDSRQLGGRQIALNRPNKNLKKS